MLTENARISLAREVFFKTNYSNPSCPDSHSEHCKHYSLNVLVWLLFEIRRLQQQRNLRKCPTYNREKRKIRKRTPNRLNTHNSLVEQGITVKNEQFLRKIQENSLGEEQMRIVASEVKSGDDSSEDNGYFSDDQSGLEKRNLFSTKKTREKRKLKQSLIEQLLQCCAAEHNTNIYPISTLTDAENPSVRLKSCYIPLLIRSALRKRKIVSPNFRNLSGEVELILNFNEAMKNFKSTPEADYESDCKGGDSGVEGDNESNDEGNDNGGDKGDSGSDNGNGTGEGSDGGCGDSNNGTGGGDGNDDGEDNEKDKPFKKDKKDDDEQDSEENDENDEQNFSVKELVDKFDRRTRTQLAMQKDEDYPTGARAKNQLDSRKTKISPSKRHKESASYQKSNKAPYVFDTPRNRNALALDYMLEESDFDLIRKYPNSPKSKDPHPRHRPRSESASPGKSFKTPFPPNEERPIKSPQQSRKKGSNRASLQQSQSSSRNQRKPQQNSSTSEYEENSRIYMSRATITFGSGTLDSQADQSSGRVGWNTDGSSSNLVVDTNSVDWQQGDKMSDKKRRQTGIIAESESDYGRSTKKLSPENYRNKKKIQSRSANMSALEDKNPSKVNQSSGSAQKNQTYYSNLPDNEYSERSNRLPSQLEKNILINKMLMDQSKDRKLNQDYSYRPRVQEEIRERRLLQKNVINDSEEFQNNSKSVTLVVPDPAAINKRRSQVRKKKSSQEIHSDTSDINYPISSSELSLRARYRSRKELLSIPEDPQHTTFLPPQKKKITRSKSRESKISSSTPISISSHYYEDERSLDLNALRRQHPITKPVNKDNTLKKEKESKKTKRSLHKTKARLVSFIKDVNNSLKSTIKQTQESYYSRRQSITSLDTDDPPLVQRMELSERDSEPQAQKKRRSPKKKDSPEKSKSPARKKNSSSPSRRNVDKESLGIQTDDEMTMDESFVESPTRNRKQHKSSRSGIKSKLSDKIERYSDDNNEEILYMERKSNRSKGTEQKEGTKLHLHREKRSKKKGKRSTLQNQEDYCNLPRSVSQNLDTNSMPVNSSSVRVKRRRSVPKSTFGTQTDDEDHDPFGRSDHNETKSLISSFSTNLGRNQEISKSTVSIQTDTPDIVVDRSLKPKPKVGPKPRYKIIGTSDINNIPISQSEIYANIPAALIYHGIKPSEESSHPTFNAETIESSDQCVHEGNSLNADQSYEGTTVIRKTPTILIEPDTEEEAPEEEGGDEEEDEEEEENRQLNTKHKKLPEPCKDKIKLGERAGSREYFRRSTERRGKRAARHRPSQRRREFDIERYGERLIRALEECLKKGELSKEVSEDTKERDLDVSSRISSQFSKSDEHPQIGEEKLNEADVESTKLTATRSSVYDCETSEVGELNSESAVDATEESLCDEIIEDLSCPLNNTVASVFVQSISDESEKDMSKNAVKTRGGDKVCSDESETPQQQLVEEASGEDEISDASCDIQSDHSSKNHFLGESQFLGETEDQEEKPAFDKECGGSRQKKRSLTLKRWVSEPSVLPDESSYEFREYKRDLIKALILIHNQSDKKDKGIIKDSVSTCPSPRKLFMNTQFYL